jgi:multicomponent Na+:H+ antiporter subunit G
MTTVVASAAVLAGAGFMFVAALGLARLPDLYTRVQAATKPATVGLAGMMCGVAVAYAEPPVTIRAILVAGFYLLTSPVAAHAIARSGLLRHVPLAPGTRRETGDPARDGDVGRRDGPTGPGARRPEYTRAGSAGGRSAADPAGPEEVR